MNSTLMMSVLLRLKEQSKTNVNENTKQIINKK